MPNDSNWIRWALRVRECNQMIRVDSVHLKNGLRRLIRGFDIEPKPQLMRAGRWIIVEHRRRSSGYKPQQPPTFCRDFLES